MHAARSDKTKARKHKFRCRWAPAKSYAKIAPVAHFGTTVKYFVSRLCDKEAWLACAISLSFRRPMRAARVHCSRARRGFDLRNGLEWPEMQPIDVFF